MNKKRKRTGPASLTGQNAWGVFDGEVCIFALKSTMQNTLDDVGSLRLPFADEQTIQRVYIKPTPQGSTGWAAVETASGDFVAAQLGTKDVLLGSLWTLGIDVDGLRLVRMKFMKAR